MLTKKQKQKKSKAKDGRINRKKDETQCKNIVNTKEGQLQVQNIEKKGSVRYKKMGGGGHKEGIKRGRGKKSQTVKETACVSELCLHR